MKKADFTVNIDREGEIKYKSVGFPGVSKMKEELLKLTK